MKTASPLRFQTHSCTHRFDLLQQYVGATNRQTEHRPPPKLWVQMKIVLPQHLSYCPTRTCIAHTTPDCATFPSAIPDANVQHAFSTVWQSSSTLDIAYVAFAFALFNTVSFASVCTSPAAHTLGPSFAFHVATRVPAITTAKHRRVCSLFWVYSILCTQTKSLQNSVSLKAQLIQQFPTFCC